MADAATGTVKQLRIHKVTHLSSMGFESANLPNTHVGRGSRRDREGAS